jgi:glycosyltransferase involved in cell wall biosynthesis
VHVFGAGLSKLGAAMAADLACSYYVSAIRYENAARDLRTGDARCAGVFAEDEVLAGTLKTICAPATPVHTAALTSAARPANNAAGGQTLVAAAIGPYGDEYGMGRLMEAARRLREAGVELQVCLQGTGKGEERLRRVAGESGLSSTTTFVDPEMPYENVVNAADIIVLAGDRRGATLPMIAAMLAGRLVLVCDTAGVEDLLGAGHGVLVAEPDAQSVADQIAAVAGDEHTRRSAGEAGPAAVLAARPLSKSIETIVAAYQGQVE